MTYRIHSPRAVVAVVAMLISASPLLAAVKRRAVSMPHLQEVTLSGTVVDAASNLPVGKVSVNASGKATTTDAQGMFSIKLPKGSPISLVISRSGYQTLTTAVALAGDTSQVFKITSGPVVTVRTTAGATYTIDFESTEFGYVAPFVGYTKDTKLNMCKTGGNSFTPDRTELKRIAGPLVSVNDAACCPQGAASAINVELKSGEKSQAILTDSCFGYKVDVLGIDHSSGESVDIHLSDISEITFP